MALLHVSLSPAQTCGGEDILYIYIFLIFPGHSEFWIPLQIPIWGPHLGCTLLQSGIGTQLEFDYGMHAYNQYTIHFQSLFRFVWGNIVV